MLQDDDYKEVPPIPLENPVKRTLRILGHDLKSIVDPYQPPLQEFSSHTDICIIGGGVMGSSIAYWVRIHFLLDDVSSTRERSIPL